MYKISKEFEFDFAHRVWNQGLVEQYALTTSNKCRQVHGHRAKVRVTLYADNIEGQNDMVLDFNNLNFFRKMINEELDHKFLLFEKDPFIRMLIPNEITDSKGDKHFTSTLPLPNIKAKGVKIDDELSLTPLDVHIKNMYNEYLSSFVILPINSTAENLSKFFCDYICDEFSNISYFNHITDVEIDFYETPTCRATYRRKVKQ